MFSIGAQFVIAWYLTLDHPEGGFERNIRYEFGDHLSDRVLKELALLHVDLDKMRSMKKSEVTAEVQRMIKLYENIQH